VILTAHATKVNRPEPNWTEPQTCLAGRNHALSVVCVCVCVWTQARRHAEQRRTQVRVAPASSCTTSTRSRGSAWSSRTEVVKATPTDTRRKKRVSAHAQLSRTIALSKNSRHDAAQYVHSTFVSLLNTRNANADCYHIVRCETLGLHCVTVSNPSSLTDRRFDRSIETRP